MDKIQDMGIDPDNPALDIEPMEGLGKGWHRLRVGDWRVVFFRSDLSRSLAVDKIGARGDVYK
jgi:mRNA-degrading endonuclease RelE of RelBE toxin-antitoxin system